MRHATFIDPNTSLRELYYALVMERCDANTFRVQEIAFRTECDDPKHARNLLKNQVWVVEGWRDFGKPQLRTDRTNFFHWDAMERAASRELPHPLCPSPKRGSLMLWVKSFPSCCLRIRWSFYPSV